MKRLELRLKEKARLEGVLLDVIEKDYAQSYILAGMMSQPSLRSALVFKGGTALKKMFFGSYRFSEDLDFSSINAPDRERIEKIICQAVEETQTLLLKFGRFRIDLQRLRETNPHPQGQEAYVIKVVYPWYGQQVCPIKIEITRDEPVLLEPLIRKIIHNYGEDFECFTPCYRLEEIVVEKMRSLLQSHARLMNGRWARPRSRDYYDLWRLMNDFGAELDAGQIVLTLEKKCSVRNVSFKRIEDFFTKELILESSSSWERSLGPFVLDLPPFDQILTDLQDYFPRFLPGIE